MSVYSPMQHFVYPILDVECTCNLCSAWRTLRAEFEEIKRVTFDHDRSCMCWRCKRRRGLQKCFLASAAKRELYSECSFHAARHPRYGNHLMKWVEREIRETPESDGWWATLAQAQPLSYWLGRFSNAFAPMMSGAASMTASGVAA